MRTISVSLGFAAMRARIAQPKLAVINRYRQQWAMKSLLERLGITLLLDVGANTGMFAESLRLMGYKGRIVSFEPNPVDHAELAERASEDPQIPSTAPSSRRRIRRPYQRSCRSPCAG